MWYVLSQLRDKGLLSRIISAFQLKPEHLERQAEFTSSDKTIPDSLVPTLQGPCGRSLTLARDGVSREVPCSALKGETVPDSERGKGRGPGAWSARLVMEI